MNTQVKFDGNKDILQGKWHELKGQVKQRWGKLTDDDMAKLTGKQEELVGLLQQRYGYAKEQAESEVNAWLLAHDKQPGMPAPKRRKDKA